MARVSGEKRLLQRVAGLSLGGISHKEAGADLSPLSVLFDEHKRTVLSVLVCFKRWSRERQTRVWASYVGDVTERVFKQGTGFYKYGQKLCFPQRLLSFSNYHIHTARARLPPLIQGV